MEYLAYLRVVREKSSIPLNEVLKYLEISQGHLSNLEAERSALQFTMFLKYCEQMGVVLSDFQKPENIKAIAKTMEAKKESVEFDKKIHDALDVVKKLRIEKKKKLKAD